MFKGREGVSSHTKALLKKFELYFQTYYLRSLKIKTQKILLLILNSNFLNFFTLKKFEFSFV